jgi:hypothetical protein
MKIRLVRDKDIAIDLARVATFLNKFCRSVKFDFYAKAVTPDVAYQHEDMMGSAVNFAQEINVADARIASCTERLYNIRHCKAISR